MSEEKKEKNLDIAASTESNATEQKIDAVATENNSVEKEQEKKPKKKFNFKKVFDTIKRSFINKQFRSGAYSSVLRYL